MKVNLIIALSLLASVAACSRSTGSERAANRMGEENFVIWTDPSTECEYIMFRQGHGGYMSPRYEADGRTVMGCRETNYDES
jgi:hypothetical protein